MARVVGGVYNAHYRRLFEMQLFVCFGCIQSVLYSMHVKIKRTVAFSTEWYAFITRSGADESVINIAQTGTPVTDALTRTGQRREARYNSSTAHTMSGSSNNSAVSLKAH